MDAYARFIDALRGRQAALGLADGAFAARVGITRQMWQQCRTERARLGLPSIQRILATFPDLTPLATALLFLPPDATNVATTATERTEEPIATA